MNEFAVGDVVESVEEWGLDNENEFLYRIVAVNDDGTVVAVDDDGNECRLDARYLELSDRAS